MRFVLRSALLSLLALGGTPCGAAGAGESRQSEIPWWAIGGQETWAGADVAASYWSVYAGQTWALGAPIQVDGWRIRAVSGYGRYHYDSRNWISGGGAQVRHRGTVSFLDILLGYQKSTGPLTIKVLAGLSGDRHDVTPVDAANPTGGIAAGVKLVLESWLNLSDQAYAAVDLAWSSAHETSTSRVRLGWRFTPTLSAGLEGAHTAIPGLLTGRAGLFLRHEWARGEASISGGVAGDDGPNGASAYGTVNVLWRF